jgi:hypothetical protein
MGIFRTAGRAAVVGAVVGRTHRRQQQRFAAEDAALAARTGTPPSAVAAQGGVVDDTDHMLTQLKQLGELRSAGVLTEEEFQAQKARILSP